MLVDLELLAALHRVLARGQTLALVHQEKRPVSLVRLDHPVDQQGARRSGQAAQEAVVILDLVVLVDQWAHQGDLAVDPTAVLVRQDRIAVQVSVQDRA